jgi:5-hydroxyisourate hydrolase
MSPITTHVLDTSLGKPAGGIDVALARQAGTTWSDLGHGTTDPDGRARSLLPDASKLVAGVYRLVFDTGAYFKAQGRPTFYPAVTIVFEVSEPDQHHHVPLLLSPFGYTTYRGS